MSSSLTNSGKDRPVIPDGPKVIKQKQHDVILALPRGGLYIGLFFLNSPGQPNRFHWGFYLHTGETTGVRHEIHDSNGFWQPRHVEVAHAFKLMCLTVFVKIGQIAERDWDRFDQITKTYDGVLNDTPGITCRVWLLMVMKLLAESGIVHLNGSVDDLEAECWSFGNQYYESAEANQQPRPTVISTVCS